MKTLTHTHTYTHTLTHTLTHTHKRTLTHKHTLTHTLSHIHTYTHTHTLALTHTVTHTHTHKHIQRRDVSRENRRLSATMPGCLISCSRFDYEQNYEQIVSREVNRCSQLIEGQDDLMVQM